MLWHLKKFPELGKNAFYLAYEQYHQGKSSLVADKKGEKKEEEEDFFLHVSLSEKWLIVNLIIEYPLPSTNDLFWKSRLLVSPDSEVE